MTTYDVPLTADRDLPIGSHLRTGHAVTLQRLETRYRYFIGEWIADRRVGAPYLEWMQQKPPLVPLISAKLRAIGESCPGIDRVEGWAPRHDPETGTLYFVGTFYAVDSDEGLELLLAPFGLPEGNRVVDGGLLLRLGALVRI